MGRKKIEFTKEQDECITQMVNDGYSLNDILLCVNNKFNTNFSRSGIDRRIKALGIDRTTNRETTILNRYTAEMVEELREWKRKQSYSHGAITEQNIADGMGICVKTLKKMYKQFDIPQRLYYLSRPDIYFDVRQCDCTTLKKSMADGIYGYILKNKPKDMRVERNVYVRTDPMTISYKVEEGNKVITKYAKMDGTDIKVDFYFPDYKTAFYCGLDEVSLTKDDVNSGMINLWSYYLRSNNNSVKLIPFIPMRTPDAGQLNLESGALTMIDRAISGEYIQWKLRKT